MIDKSDTATRAKLSGGAPVVLWFRNDLRLADHRALVAAIATGAPIVCVYILDDATPGTWKMGAASRWWLSRSLKALSNDIATLGGKLILRRGGVGEALPKLVEDVGASAVYCTRGYEPWAVALEADLNRMFESSGIALKRYGGYLLREPGEVRTKSGDAYKVYTPFWRALSEGYSPPRAIAAPKLIHALAKHPATEQLSDWDLAPSKPNWAKGWDAIWRPGEAGARDRLDDFLSLSMPRYAVDRNQTGQSRHVAAFATFAFRRNFAGGVLARGVCRGGEGFRRRRGL